ncbi:MAG: YifB family Mg chelatase-like AAA ATPase [Actinomycetota bacterium]
MLAKTLSVALVGADAHVVEVEVHATQGVPSFTIVGLPAKSVREAEQRTRSALLSSDERWPPSRMVANLAPASLRKEGTHFDLAIAVGVLAGDARLSHEQVEGWVFMGELGLDGSVRRVRGALSAAMAAASSRLKGIMCPAVNAAEAALVDGLSIVPVATLGECVRFLRGQWAPPAIPRVRHVPGAAPEDMSEVRGQSAARRALEIAAAGGHNFMMRGAPGCGKTMIARRLPGILPVMSKQESLDVTRIHSVAGLLEDRHGLIEHRPFRTPHHNVSVAGLVGGGSGIARPGEVALAHHGVLFMDEIPLFRRDALESLRGPLEDGIVRIARGGGVVSFPCRFSLVAAMNPCPCGYREDQKRGCECTDQQLRAYRGRVSGPLLDRFDIHLGMRRVRSADLVGRPQGERSEVVRERVEAARDVQRIRFESPSATNASVPKKTLLQRGRFRSDVFAPLCGAIDDGSLTGRGMERVLRVARTIADLAGRAEVDKDHVAEALMFRLTDDPLGMAA